MKLTIKTLQGAKFEVDAEPSSSIMSVKELCAKEKEVSFDSGGRPEMSRGKNHKSQFSLTRHSQSDASQIKLIHSGKVLADDATVEGSGVTEKG